MCVCVYRGVRKVSVTIRNNQQHWLVASSVIHKLADLLSGCSSQLSVIIAQGLDSHPPTSHSTSPRHTRWKQMCWPTFFLHSIFMILEFRSLSPLSVFVNVSVFTGGRGCVKWCTSKCSSLLCISAESLHLCRTFLCLCNNVYVKPGQAVKYYVCTS